MIFYFTFNDQPSGIYSSQVLDVVSFLNEKTTARVRLVSFISLRNFKANRRIIKKAQPEALVLPMVPGVQRWKKNAHLLKALCAIHRPSAIIGRSVMATTLASTIKGVKIVYDGRGAIAAEWKEYGVINDAGMLAEIDGLEKSAVQASDFRIAVSQQLVKHWQEQFAYTGAKHVIIPCTVNKVFENLDFTPVNVARSRAELGYNDTDLVYVYSGSVAGWQSFELMAGFLRNFLKRATTNKILFLSQEDQNIAQLKNEFPEQVTSKSVSPSQVPQYLMAADHGLLIREQSVTNKVASPVKFAEYLFCGLRVFISENLGDYTDFVAANDCGSLYTNTAVVTRPSFAEKQKLRQLAGQHFSKQGHLSHYREMVTAASA